MNFKHIISLAGIGLVVLVLLSVFLGSWYRVDEGERAVVLTNGAFSQVAEPGLHFKLPFFQSVKYISVRNEVVSIDKMESYTADQQPGIIRVSVNFQATNAETIYKQYGSIDEAVTRIINPQLYKQVKIVFGKYTAQRAINDRGPLNNEILDALTHSTNADGLQILSVQIEDISYTPGYMLSVEQAAKAKTDVERAKSELAKVDVEAQQKVVQANAEATATKLNADAAAYATQAAGKATASAIRERGAALKDNPQLVSLVAAEKWNGMLPTSMIPGSSVPFINVGAGQDAQQLLPPVK
jgi:regulator of protease activity HflC (stomatin/prohibitin superfamily)